MFGKNPAQTKREKDPENSVGAELGVWQGESLRKF